MRSRIAARVTTPEELRLPALFGRFNRMTSVSELYALQEIDLALASRRDERSEIEARFEEPEELIEAKRELEERQASLREAERNFKEHEAEADSLAAKIEPIEKKLYQGTVRNPKELEDLQADLNMLKRRRSELDDQALAAMETLEAAQRALEEAKERVREIEAARGEELADLSARREQLQREIEELSADREEQAAGIDRQMLALYDRLASTRGGRAVAKVEGGACQGCRISLPMNVIQRARGGNRIVQCSSCERILYVS